MDSQSQQIYFDIYNATEIKSINEIIVLICVAFRVEKVFIVYMFLLKGEKNLKNSTIFEKKKPFIFIKFLINNIRFKISAYN